MVKIVGVVKADEIPPQSRIGSGIRNGLTEAIMTAAYNLPPKGQYVKIRHDYVTASATTARIQNVVSRNELPAMQVIVRGQHVFLGRR